MKRYPVLNVTSPEVVLGKHAVWIPTLQVKVPFQWGGRLQKYQHPHERSYPRNLLAEEVSLLRWLAGQKMAPPIGDWVFFETVISEHPGARWIDPCGALGYEMQDVSTFSDPGMFSLEAVRGSGLVSGSEGAWHDLLVPERRNVVNGYCVDVRRSGFDCLRWHGPLETFPLVAEDRHTLLADLRRDGQFPFQERTLAYQECYFADTWWQGERDVVRRAELLGFTPHPGESVVDLGCALGGFLQFAWLQGARRLIGIDSQPEYVVLARRVARRAGMNLHFEQMDLTAPIYMARVERWLRGLLPQGIDHLLALSMHKHLGDRVLWEWVDRLAARSTYLESNATKVDLWPLCSEVEARGGKYVGDSHDRNLRRLYRIERRE